MSTPLALDAPAPVRSQPAADRAAPPRLAQLRQAIEHAAHLLPAQGPITVFIHHNTLHAFEELPFTEAVVKAGKLFGCQPYLDEERFREELGRGRIRLADLDAVVTGDVGDAAADEVLSSTTRRELRLAMLQYPLRSGPTEELLWFVAETDALRRIRSDTSAAVRRQLIAETRHWVLRDLRGGAQSGAGKRTPEEGSGASHDVAHLADLLERFQARVESWNESTWEAATLQLLWRVCCRGVATAPPANPETRAIAQPAAPVRHRDSLLQAVGVDSDLPVHDLLIRFCGAFLDQGLAHWQLPQRDEGFFRAFCALYRRDGSAQRWLGDVARAIASVEQRGLTPLESILESLGVLGVEPGEWDSYLAATLLALRGWGGIIRFLEERGDRAVHPVSHDSLIEFLAVRLLLDRCALADTARRAMGFGGSLADLRDELTRRLAPPPPVQVEQRAFAVFQLAQVLGWTPEHLHRLNGTDWATLLRELDSFPALERRRVFHLAYERRFYTQTLDALALHNRHPRRQPAAPWFQAMFCIDEREESLRRHVEELAPQAVTYGIAGFYFLDIYYRGAADAHFVPLAPAIMRPRYWLAERVVDNLEETHERRARTRRALGKAAHRAHLGSRSFALGAVLSAAVGVMASAPLIARTLFPRLTARIRKRFGRLVQPPSTRLELERRYPNPGPENGHVGLTLDEMTAAAERVLRDTGLTSGFARLVFTFGHGSTSMNNPHESAHDCGACGGARGGPNGRAIAQILNDARIRERLRQHGIDIPATTVFIGGMHNTSSETMTYYDLDCLPLSHRQEFEAIRAVIEQALDRDAHERCRRFGSAPLELSFEAARQHVEGRAEDLAQVRPEWGHATNAICVVGRRERTRGLFLDRRAFLNSYDPTQDDGDGSILTRILQAAVPVCAGISLEYYFSYVDNVGYGCGTKLPHNIASLLGVMNGAASDLRTGLPWQMVEIHEPVRILFVIETSVPTMQRILERNPAIARLVRNGWVQLAVLDPDSPKLWFYRDGGFQDYQPQAAELPRAASSVDWYRGWRDHLEFAAIGS
jgi:uncharacterized protein